MDREPILVTGGAGYIGSHVCKALYESGALPIAFDNLSRGHPWAVKWGPLFSGDILNPKELDQAFLEFRPSAVIHLASLINVRESIEHPAKYYHNNVTGTLSLLEVMVRHNVKRLVFSSSAAVYGNPEYTPIDENHPKNPMNPYGKTKWMVENLLEDFFHAYGLSSLSLRYFNAAGADLQGKIGEAHHPETHLIPLLLATALKKRSLFTLFCDSYPTSDGTAVRDFVHVNDLADAHVKGLEWLKKNPTRAAFNLGTGTGYSVREMIKAVQKTTGLMVPTETKNQNFKEPEALIADPTLAQTCLGWYPKSSSLENIVQTAWSWHTQNSPL